MSTEEKGKVSPQNQIPIDKDKLKEEQKAELKAATDAYEQRCLLSYSTNRSGEVIKNYDFPTLLWQNHLNYPGSSALAITIKATPTQTHFKWNNSWSVG